MSGDRPAPAGAARVAGDRGASIAPARDGVDVAAVRALFGEYVAGLGIDSSLLHGIEAELAGLPGDYAPPLGSLLLARDQDGVPVGCVGLRPLPSGRACEMKRLYVRPAGRGLGLGRALAAATIAEATALGYREIRLDTLPHLSAAIALYRDLGFAAGPAYRTDHPPGALCFARPLGGRAPARGTDLAEGRASC